MSTDEIQARLSALERQMAEIRTQFKSVAHELREDDGFMRPAAQKFGDHIADHWFDKAARRLLWAVLGIFGAAAVGLAMFLTGRSFK